MGTKRRPFVQADWDRQVNDMKKEFLEELEKKNNFFIGYSDGYRFVNTVAKGLNEKYSSNEVFFKALYDEVRKKIDRFPKEFNEAEYTAGYLSALRINSFALVKELTQSLVNLYDKVSVDQKHERKRTRKRSVPNART